MNCQVFAAFRGVLGGFCGAFLGGLIWINLCAGFASATAVPSLFKILFLLMAVLVGPLSCLGYWLFRGLRNRKFAYISTRLCAFSGTCAAVFRFFLPQGSAWCLLFGLFAFLFSQGWMQTRLLRYTDPAWYADPRRAAVSRAGGAMYNYRSRKIPLPAVQIPPVFSVGNVLEVRGLILRTTPNLRKSRTFLVEDVAGVILGPSNGSNVLFDRNHQVLAKFAWSMKNADLLAQILDGHGIRFCTCKEYGYSLGAVTQADDF